MSKVEILNAIMLFVPAYIHIQQTTFYLLTQVRPNTLCQNSFILLLSTSTLFSVYYLVLEFQSTDTGIPHDFDYL